MLLFFVQSAVASNNQRANTIYNHLDQKYKEFSITEQQVKRKEMKSLFFQIKRKNKNEDLDVVLDSLLKKSIRKVNALEQFEDSYNQNYTFQILLDNNTIILTKDPNNLGNFANTARTIHKEVWHDLDLVQQNILALINIERAKINLWALTLNSSLTKAAQWHADYMFKTRDFNHTTKAWLKFNERIKAAGFEGRTMWENIAYNQRSETTVMEAWMNSPWHKANILNPNFTQVGVWFSSYYWVQNFGG